MTIEVQELMLTPTAVEYQDVKAEAELLKLETGKTEVNLRIIWAKMASSDRVLYYGDYHPRLDTARIPWDQGTVDPAIIEALVSWALKQSPDTQELLFGFLDSGDKENELPRLLDQLGIAERKPKTKKKGISMAEVMRKSLPATKEELIALVQEFSPETKRPAARVRQFIRDETRAGRIELSPDGSYHHV